MTLMKPFVLLALAGCLLLGLVPAAQPGGEEVKPVNLGKLNTEADEDDPCPLPDGITLLYVTKKTTYDIYLSQRTGPTAAWPPGKPKAALASPDFDERTPFFHKPSNMIYYAHNQAPGVAPEDKNFDIVRKLGETGAVPLQGVST